MPPVALLCLGVSVGGRPVCPSGCPPVSVLLRILPSGHPQRAAPSTPGKLQSAELHPEYGEGCPWSRGARRRVRLVSGTPSSRVEQPVTSPEERVYSGMQTNGTAAGSAGCGGTTEPRAGQPGDPGRGRGGLGKGELGGVVVDESPCWERENSGRGWLLRRLLQTRRNSSSGTCCCSSTGFSPWAGRRGGVWGLLLVGLAAVLRARVGPTHGGWSSVPRCRAEGVCCPSRRAGPLLRGLWLGSGQQRGGSHGCGCVTRTGGCSAEPSETSCCVRCTRAWRRRRRPGVSPPGAPAGWMDVFGGFPVPGTRSWAPAGWRPVGDAHRGVWRPTVNAMLLLRQLFHFRTADTCASVIQPSDRHRRAPGSTARPRSRLCAPASRSPSTGRAP